MFISLKVSVTAFSPWQQFLQLRTSPLSSEIVPPQYVSPTIPNIHGPCSCMNCQHSKLFPPCHNLRMPHLLKPHSPLPLNNMLTLHSNLIPQDQQPPTSWDHVPSPCTPELPKSHDRIPTQCLEQPHTLTCYQQRHLAYPYFHKPKTCSKQDASQTRFRTLSSTSPWPYEKPLLLWNSLQQQTIQPISLLSPHLENWLAG